MIRSRRLALVALVVTFGIASCGDPNSASSSTSPSAHQPKVIQLAAGQTSGGAGAPAAQTAAADASTESKIAVFAPTEFVYDGELPALDGPAASWFFAPGQQPDLDRVAKMATALGVTGDVRVLSADQGGGWAIGPEDFSGPVLTVGSDGLLTWYLSASPTVSSIGCATVAGTAAIEPAAGTGVAGSSGTAIATPAPDAKPSEGTAPPAIEPATTFPECTTPPLPQGVPTKDEALAKAKDLFTSLGYDLTSYAFDDVFADQYGASVNASLVLDGMKAQIMLSVGFGENGSITYASGSLAVPQPGGDYPTIGAAAGLERLKTQQNQFIGLAADGVATKTAVDAGAAVQPAIGAPEIAPCDSSLANVDCATPPADVQPVTVTLNTVKRDLTMVWAADNTIWLLPAYTFGSADGGIYTVNAVDDAYLQQTDANVASTAPAPVPDTAVAPPANPAPADCVSPDVTTPGGVSADRIASGLPGLCLAVAQDLAKQFGFELRVVRQDGVDLPVTDDHSDSRINVAVDNGVVTSVVSIG